MKRRKLITLIILIAGIYFIISLAQSNIQLWQQGKTVEPMRLRNELLKKENEGLRQTLSQVESEEFIEREARDKLNMGKPGEAIVIIPESFLATPSASESSKELPNWEKWKRLFE